MRIFIIILLCGCLSGCGFLFPQYSNQKANNAQEKQLTRIADSLERIEAKIK